MSGGHFDYKQYSILTIIEQLESILSTNDYNLNDNSLEHIKIGKQIVELAYIYVQRIDWLVSGDDGEKEFIERLNEELNSLIKTWRKPNENT